MPAARPVFVTRVRSADSARAARLLVQSIRRFGGAVADRPAWVFADEPLREEARRALDGLPDVAVIPLAVPADAAPLPFADKVVACARAEQVAGPGSGTLAWIDPECLVVAPPLLLDLGAAADAAFRPVHLRNVGLSPSGPLDPFWAGICAVLGTADVPGTVESFVDGQVLRSYFNTHCFAVNPRLGLMTRWEDALRRLAGDVEFLREACADETHRIFLFQAVLAALAASSIEPGRIRILPPSYSYPYHLHGQVPPARRAASLGDLVCVALEDRVPDPTRMAGIAVPEPLASWLAARAAGASPTCPGPGP